MEKSLNIIKEFLMCLWVLDICKDNSSSKKDVTYVILFYEAEFWKRWSTC